jgi:hypothetical protein
MFNTKLKSKSIGVEIQDLYCNQVKTRNEYYSNLILELFKSKAQSLSNGLYLDKAPIYGYFIYDERIIVYWDSEVDKLLNSNGVDAWNDSAGGLIVGLKK